MASVFSDGVHDWRRAHGAWLRLNDTRALGCYGANRVLIGLDSRTRMFLEPRTIAQTLARIDQGLYVLPAVQREFVWPDRKIVALFDSLMRGYPIGTFLFWHVSDQTVRDHTFYGFLKNFDPRGSGKYCPRLEALANSDDRYAVLDGQQRLTSLRIGIHGSHTIKLPRMWWDNPAAFQKRVLYLDVKAHAVAEDESDDEESGDTEQYLFRFRTETQAQQDNVAGKHQWVKVGDALGLTGYADVMAYASKHFGGDPHAGTVFGRLVEVLNTIPTVTGYVEHQQEIDRVMNIFIRVNAQGEPLSFADLLLSQATAAWSQGDGAVDAREEIRAFVDALNETGGHFSFKRDQIMKSTLMLTGAGSLRFRIENYDTRRMLAIRDEWDDIKRWLTLGVQLLATFGFSSDNLRANSVLHPLAYYIKRRGLNPTYLTSPVHAEDRQLVRGWVIRSMLKPGVWGSGLDTLLTRIRDVIDSDGEDGFPAHAIAREMSDIGKDLSFSDGEIDTLLKLRYGDRDTFALLSLLYPPGATAERHHVDHIFPRSKARRRDFAADGLDRELADRVDELSNLQLLTPLENMSKGGNWPASWLDAQFPDPSGRAAVVALHELHGVSDSLADFVAFLDRRRPLLRARIVAALGAPL